MPGISHVFSSPKADGADTTLVKPSNWNSQHAGPAISIFQNLIGANTLTSTNLTASTRSLFVFPLYVGDNAFPGDITASTARILMGHSITTTATNVAAFTLNMSLGIYVVSASNSQATLSLLNSASWSWGSGGTIASTNYSVSGSGIRWATIHSSQWSTSATFTNGGQYYGALLMSTGGPSVGNWGPYGASQYVTLNISGAFGAASVSNTSVGVPYYCGIYSATTAALPAAINVSELNKQNAMANFVPWVAFDMLNASH
ncbi:MAG: hypothetical protein ACHQNA_11875 [Acidimicrobiales bacterium]